MPLFAHIDTHVIAFRQHEFNTEALDGILELLQDSEECNIVAHHPNKKFGYDVGILETLSAINGWEKVEKLGHFDSDNPSKIFYELIPSKYYKDYVNKENFYSKEFETPLPQDVRKTSAIKEVFDIPSKIQSNIAPSVNTNTPRLVRGTEKAIYKYRSPSEKYGV
ncbi:MAG TPA: hypothetical protein PKN48_00315 [Bacteroidales bacterium]|nr:hypothetical protein [Bacteroidales bacterium]